MKRCHNEEELIALYYDGIAGDGEEDGALAGHLRECLGCRARFERVRADLDSIGDALGSAPPLVDSRPEPRRAFGGLLGWTSALAAAGFALVLAGGLGGVLDKGRSVDVASDAVVSLISDDELDRFTESLLEEVEPSSATDEELYLRAALDGAMPCSWNDVLSAELYGTDGCGASGASWPLVGS